MLDFDFTSKNYEFAGVFVGHAYESLMLMKFMKLVCCVLNLEACLFSFS